MENMNPSSPPGSPTSPISIRVRELDKLLESLGIIVPPPTSEPSCLEENEELEEKIKEEITDEEEEDDLEYFKTIPTREELEYHEWLLKNHRPSWVRTKIRKGSLDNIKIPCMIGYFLKEKTYIDLESLVNIMARLYYYWIMSEGLKSREKLSNPRKTSNFVERVRGIKVFVGNFTYECDFMILEDVSSAIR
ncbi:hypothetical protein Tco_0856124 [Tanacetum coccineum]